MSIDVFPATVLNSTLWNGQTYEEGTFTVTATGFSGTAPSGTAQYVRMGKLVTLMVPTLQGTSNATTFAVTGLPAALWPLQNLNSPALCADAGVNLYAHHNVTSAGAWTMSRETGTAWTASGTKGVYFCALTYMLA